MDEIKVELQRSSFKEFGITQPKWEDAEFIYLQGLRTRLDEKPEYPEIENIFTRNDSSAKSME